MKVQSAWGRGKFNSTSMMPHWHNPGSIVANPYPDEGLSPKGEPLLDICQNALQNWPERCHSIPSPPQLLFQHLMQCPSLSQMLTEGSLAGDC